MGKLSDFSEDDLTAGFRALFGPAPEGQQWTGDDAAVVRVATGDLLFTTDTMTEHVDFELSWATGEDIGYKLVAVNVSDIAAMGGSPSAAVASIVAAVELDREVVEGIARGMKAAGDRWGVQVVGGDIGRGSELTLSMALLGRPPAPPVLRSGARVGDAICVTGALGGAAAGLRILQAGVGDRDALRAEIAQPTGADALALLSTRQLRPQARLDEGRALAGVGVTAMIDVSDGLVVDLGRLLTASGVGCEVAASAIPIDPEIGHAVDRLPEPVEPARLALTGGEDFELLFTIDPDLLDDVQDALDGCGTSMTLLGRTTDGLARIDGEALETWMEGTWDHLRAP